jgi:predicted phage tail protein
MRDYFSSTIGLQTIAGCLVMLSFPFVYVGSQSNRALWVAIGMSMILIGVIAAPCITLIDKRKQRGGKQMD